MELQSLIIPDFETIAIVFVSILTLITCFIFVSFVKSGKSFSHYYEEQKFDFFYNIMGLEYLLDDFINREKNKNLELKELPNKIAVITGGTRGIGREVVKLLLQCKIHVVIGCRNLEAGKKLIESFGEEELPDEITLFELDVSSIDSVKKFAGQVVEKFPKINILINNAGIMFTPKNVESKDGFELQFATNYLGHYLLTHLLLPNIKAAGDEDTEPARIINVSSCAHLMGEINYEDINNKNNYIPAFAYSQSKLAQVIFTKYLERIFRKNEIKVLTFSIHPGIVDTDLFENTILKKYFPRLLSMFFKSSKEGAIPIVFACISKKLKDKSGSYISNCEILPSKEETYFPQSQDKLIEFTNKLLSIEEFGKVSNKC